jgi:hypothetical protein
MMSIHSSTHLIAIAASNVTQGLLAFAGLCCCVAMSMPQVHLVVDCGDPGYGPARGAEMLAPMLGLGVVSRPIFGRVLIRIGGLPTLLAAGLDHAGHCTISTSLAGWRDPRLDRF